MINTHATIYVEQYTPINFFGKTIGHSIIGSQYQIPFEIEPTQGIHDYNNCEKCKVGLRQMTISLQKMFDGTEKNQGFPFCCSGHSNLINVKEYNRESFVGVPEMVARKIIYTNQHIVNNYRSANWYKEITDYIEWVVMSFGAMPTNCGEPLFLKGYFDKIIPGVKDEPNFPKDKRKRILEFIESVRLPGPVPNTDINILLATYHKWIKIFPFELSYFQKLKARFENLLPIISGELELNVYSGIAKAKLHTKSSLIEALIDRTNDLLIQINGLTLYNQGGLNDINKLKLELLLNSRTLKLKEGYKNDSSNEEKRYRRILKQWFADEMAFFSELTPLLKEPLVKSNKTDQDIPKSFEDLFYNAHDAEPCLSILKELEPAVVDKGNNFVGNNKGVFPLWIKILKSHKPKPLIKHFKDKVYKDLLNMKISGLRLSKDASEFRRHYNRLSTNNTDLDIKALLSQLSQKGILGK